MAVTGIPGGVPGTWSGANFREKIRFAMIMGYPVPPNEQPIFQFEPTETYPPGTEVDLEGKPLNPTIGPVTTTPPDFAFAPPMACAVETDVPSLSSFDELEPGVIRRLRATITMLDEEKTALFAAGDPKWVKLGGDRYLILMVLPSMGLFDVTVYQLLCGSVEEE